MKTLIKSKTEVTNTKPYPIINKFDNGVKFGDRVISKYDILLKSGKVMSLDDYDSSMVNDVIGICIGKHPNNGKSLFISILGLELKDGWNPDYHKAICKEYPAPISVDKLGAITGSYGTGADARKNHTYDGFNRTKNTIALIEEESSLNLFPAYEFIKNYNPGYGAGLWYIPDLLELDMITPIWNELNTKLSIIDPRFHMNQYFWSSRFYSSEDCWGLSLFSDDLGDVYCYDIGNGSAAVLPFLAIN